MILALGITLVVLIVGTWIYSMYISWKATEGVPLALVESTTFLVLWHRATRLSRRGLYSTQLFSKKVFDWSTQKTRSTLVKFFPTSAPLFAKRDMMTGLTHGPSSYFLKSISKNEKSASKRLPKTKKMI